MKNQESWGCIISNYPQSKTSVPFYIEFLYESSIKREKFSDYFVQTYLLNQSLVLKINKFLCNAQL